MGEKEGDIKIVEYRVSTAIAEVFVVKMMSQSKKHTQGLNVKMEVVQRGTSTERLYNGENHAQRGP